MSNFQIIESHVGESALAAEEKFELLSVLARVADDALVDVVELIAKYPEWVEVLFGNLVAKRQVLADHDEEGIATILKEEEKMLETLSE